VQVQKTKPGYKRIKSLVGKIPEKWKIVSLKELADVKGGKRLPKGEKFSKKTTALPYIRVTDFKNNSVDMSNIQFLKTDIQEKIKRYTISVNDLYISIAGTIGLVGSIPKELDNANLTENAAKICNIKNITKDFLLHSLNSTLIQNQIQSYRSKSSQPKFALFRIEKLKILLPPLPKQEKIASILSNVDSLTHQYEKIIESTKKLKIGLMQQLLTKGIGHNKFKQVILFPYFLSMEIPEEWETKTIGELTQLTMGQSPPGESYSDFKGTPLLNGPTEFGLFHPIPVQYTTKPTKMCESNDILICVRGSTTGRLNRADQRYCIGRGLAAIRGKKGKASTDWLFTHFERLQTIIFHIASGSGTTFPNINRDLIKKFIIPYPKLPEQEKIASVLSNVDTRIFELESKKSSFELLKKGLMQKLLTGQILVH